MKLLPREGAAYRAEKVSTRAPARPPLKLTMSCKISNPPSHDIATSRPNYEVLADKNDPRDWSLLP